MNMNTAPKNLPQSPQGRPQSKSNIPFNAGIIPHFEVNNAILPSEQEKILYEQEKEKERQAVVNQVGVDFRKIIQTEFHLVSKIFNNSKVRRV